MVRHRTVGKFEMPTYAHIPGINQRHPDGFAETIITTLPDRICPHSEERPIALDHALELIDKGFYWEAHEVLEAIWMRADKNSREQHMLQALIQLANAALKRKMNRPNAVERLAGKVTENLRRGYLQHPDASVMGLSKAWIEQELYSHIGIQKQEI